MVAFKSQQHHPVDRQLEQRVSAALAEFDPLGTRRVTVQSRFGVVVLQGVVATEWLKSQAFHLVQAVPGVLAVADAIQVRSATRLSAPSREVAEPQFSLSHQ